ncbi:hypothetical protein ACFOLF_27455 [Paenibacillus sepulcri]|uniref:Extracellular solute-binding protein n=1 Tax=Paenibacillus sepulcri TaxID=359917 RepID=A0ABS7C188_9BACL|nr:hypothetical protein [Paenibacillus sepulcri]
MLLRLPTRFRALFAGFALLVLCMTLSGCGSNADLTVFIMPKEYLPDGVAAKVEEQLKAKFGEEKTIEVNASPMYNDQKLIVEIAAGGNGILILPKDTLMSMITQGPAIQLDKWFDASAYPEGVLESDLGDSKNPKLVKGLFAIPVEKTIFKDAGYNEPNMLMIIPANAPDQDLSIEVMKELVKP